MMRIFFLVSFCIAICNSSFAACPELQKMKTAYTGQLTKINSEPISDVQLARKTSAVSKGYVKLLRELERYLSKKGRMDDLVDVRLERKRILKKLETQARTEKKAPPAEKKADKKKTLVEVCFMCGGTGVKTTVSPCPNSKCKNGYIEVKGGMGLIQDKVVRNVCSVCNGTGTVTRREPCERCHGTGKIYHVIESETGSTPTGEDDLAGMEAGGITDDGNAEQLLPSLPKIPGGKKAPVKMECRPKAPGLDFSSVRKRIGSYLAEQSPEAAALERARLAYISKARMHLLAYMKYLPFEDPEGKLSLSNGQTFRGHIVMASEDRLAVRPLDGGKMKQAAWDNFTPQQFFRILEFYAKKRVETGKSQEASADYLLLALLADWYGFPKQAKLSLIKAEDCYPKAGEIGRAFLYYLYDQ